MKVEFLVTSATDFLYCLKQFELDLGHLQIQVSQLTKLICKSLSQTEGKGLRTK